METNKAAAYIGFAVRKGAAVFGLDKLSLCKKKVYAVFYSPSLSKNSLKKLTELCSRLSVSLSKAELETILKRNCKVLGICDKSLAEAAAGAINE